MLEWFTIQNQKPTKVIPVTMSKKTAKHKGYIKWLVTWEGYDFDPNSRCKIVTALPPQYSEHSIAKMLPFLLSATYGGLLGDRIHYGTIRNTSIFKKPYRNYYVEMWFGWIPKEYLSARLVENFVPKMIKAIFGIILCIGMNTQNIDLNPA
jgi:hypothetical protein